jgi:hypothetical protein
MLAEIQRIADALSPITADSKISDVKVTISLALEKYYWSETNRAANFLKHADRDSEATLSLDDIDNRLLVMKCCSAYRDIAPDDLGNEGLVFEAFVAATNPAHQLTDSSFDSLVGRMRSVPNERQMELCYMVITQMNED